MMVLFFQTVLTRFAAFSVSMDTSVGGGAIVSGLQRSNLGRACRSYRIAGSIASVKAMLADHTIKGYH